MQEGQDKFWQEPCRVCNLSSRCCWSFARHLDRRKHFYGYDLPELLVLVTRYPQFSNWISLLGATAIGELKYRLLPKACSHKQFIATERGARLADSYGEELSSDNDWMVDQSDGG